MKRIDPSECFTQYRILSASFIASWLIVPQGSPATEVFIVDVDAVGEGCGVETLIPAFQTVFFPDLIQVNVLPAEETF